MKSFFFKFFLSAFFSLTCFSVFAQVRYPFKDEKGLYGFKDEKGKVKIKPQFEQIDGFQAGYDQGWMNKYRGVKLNGKWGYINREGDVMIPYQYEMVSGMIVTVNGKKGLIDLSGKQILPAEYTTLVESYPLFIASTDDRKYGFIDSSNNVVIPMVYDSCRKFDNEIIIVKDKEGGYDWRSPNRLAAVKMNGSWGFINFKNDFVIPPIYKYVQDFKYVGITWVSVDGYKYGAVSRANKLHVPFLFTEPGEWDRYAVSTAKLGYYNEGSVNAKAVFTKKDSQPIQLSLRAGEPAAAEAMIRSGYQAIKDGYPKEAIQWFTKAYNNGSAEAARILADTYMKDTSKKQNIQTAIQWYKNGADRLDLICLTELAQFNYLGANMPVNDSTAFMMLKKMAAASNGYDPALDYTEEEDFEFINAGISKLADFYKDGTGTPKDPRQAFYWYSKAANGGDYYANLMLGDAYYNGNGTTKDLKKALENYLVATDEYDEAMYAAGIMFYKGEGTEKNKEVGTTWLKYAAKNGFTKAIEFLKKEGIK